MMNETIDKYQYQILVSALSNEDGGGFIATVPELPGCMSDGATHEEACKNALLAIDAWIDTAKKLGRRVPIPKVYEDNEPSGKFTVRISKTMHAELIELAKREGVSLNSLTNEFLAMGIGNNFSQLKNKTKRETISSDSIFTAFEKESFDNSKKLREKWNKMPRMRSLKALLPFR